MRSFDDDAAFFIQLRAQRRECLLKSGVVSCQSEEGQDIDEVEDVVSEKRVFDLQELRANAPMTGTDGSSRNPVVQEGLHGWVGN